MSREPIVVMAGASEMFAQGDICMLGSRPQKWRVLESGAGLVWLQAVHATKQEKRELAAAQRGIERWRMA